MQTHLSNISRHDRRAVTVPDGSGKLEVGAGRVSLSRAPWEAAESALTARPETNPRQAMLKQKRRATTPSYGDMVRSVVAEELMRMREEFDPSVIDF